MNDIAVLGAGAFVRGYAGLPQIVAGESDDAFDAPKAAEVPARQRRRASTLSRALADAYAETIRAAGANAETVASVIGSALGEAETMIGLLDQMWSETPTLSPMKFAMSVHNAAAGMLSIAAGNRGFTTSIGADFDTPAMALLEGIAWVETHGEAVVVCCGDEEPPADLVPGGAAWGLVAAAVTLAPLAATPNPIATLTAPRAVSEGGSETVEPMRLEESLTRNPCVGLLDLAIAIDSRKSGSIRLDRGRGRGFGTTLSFGAPSKGPGVAP